MKHMSSRRTIITKFKNLISLIFITSIFLANSLIWSQPIFQKKNEEIKVDQVNPPHWWVDFKSEKLQLLIKSNQIKNSTVNVNYPGVEIVSVHNADSPNYLFIDLKISKNTAPGFIELLFSKDDEKVYKLDYELKKRERSSLDFVGFSSKDVIYLITPDRYVNSNLDNDIIPNLREKKIDRDNDYARHGGDIQGITNNLNYIHDMGFTAIWSSPLRINDMNESSYHGYAITDHYKTDPRFGTLDEFKNLVSKANDLGIKFIMDQIVNHCGLYHWWIEDLPFDDWLNNQKDFLSGNPTKYSNHFRTINQDLYASKIDKLEMTDGWFVDTMPDLNHKNNFMQEYLIQNSIWWIEELGLGGIRQDTYPYADKEFMSNWAGAIMNEYPNFSIVGEEWSFNPLLIGYWQNDKNSKYGYVSNLTSTMDFAMLDNIKKAVSQKESWNKGLIKLYEGLANDFHYPNPEAIMVMMDNHDMSRIYTQLNGNLTQTKMAMSTILMIPRVPQIYYGTEILMDDFERPGDHGLIRTDFPGGWPNDEVNAFSGKGLNQSQKDMQQFLKKLLNFRKNSKAIHNGSTIHFAPKEGVYFLFRKKDEEIVFLILNKNENLTSIDLSRFDELNLEGKTFQNIFNDEYFTWNKTLNLSEPGTYIYSLINN